MDDSMDAVRQVMLSINSIDGIYYFCARKLGVNENTLALLYALSDGKTYSQKQVCEEWLIPKTTINTIVRELTEKGYISLETEPHSREKHIQLTEAGTTYAQEILQGIFAAERQAMEETMQAYSPEAWNALTFFSQRLCALLRSHILDRKD